ncbi:hypothetical protein ACHAXT_001551 [Thalassiosira profunda]
MADEDSKVAIEEEAAAAAMADGGEERTRNAGTPPPIDDDAAAATLISPAADAAAATSSKKSFERRGSGFLLLAAEAYEAAERTQQRADAIRQVAADLATAAGAAVPGGGQLAGPGPDLRERVYAAAARLQQEGMGELDAAARLRKAAVPALKSPQKEGGGGQKKAPRKSKRERRRSWKGEENELKAEPPRAAPLVPTGKTEWPPLEAPLVPTGKSSARATKETTHPSGRQPVKHIYHDYGAVPDTDQHFRKKTGGVATPFPEKLMNMLDIESVRRPSIVSWLPHGRAFLVRRPKEFSGEVMGDHFKQSKLTSFQRQLNLYGFRRITRGTDAGAYYHELFLRGRPKLSQRMQRMKVKGTGHKQPTDASTEPNFYAMPPLAEAEVGGDGTEVQGSGESVFEAPPPFPLSNAAPPLAPPDSPCQERGGDAEAAVRVQRVQHSRQCRGPAVGSTAQPRYQSYGVRCRGRNGISGGSRIPAGGAAGIVRPGDCRGRISGRPGEFIVWRVLAKIVYRRGRASQSGICLIDISRGT